jgi:DNA-binding NarL/FixJ family response regulator
VTAPPPVIRIIVADDHEVVRAGFAAQPDTQPDFAVAGTARDGAEAVRICGDLRPDVVLMDVRMPGMDGIEATRQLTGPGQDGPRILILTTFDLDEYVYDPLCAGASGFLLKDVTAERLFDAVRVVAAGPGGGGRARRHPPPHQRVRPAARLHDKRARHCVRSSGHWRGQRDPGEPAGESTAAGTGRRRATAGRYRCS